MHVSIEIVYSFLFLDQSNIERILSTLTWQHCSILWNRKDNVRVGGVVAGGDREWVNESESQRAFPSRGGVTTNTQTHRLVEEEVINLKHTKFWEEQRYGNGSRRGPIPRITALSKVSSKFTGLDNVLQVSGSPFYEAPGPKKFIQEAWQHVRYSVPKVSLCN
jgi:hypothetical protein